MYLRIGLGSIFIIGVLTGRLTAQSVFQERVLIYRVDTVRRLEAQPAAYIPTQMKLFKKGNLIRLERESISRFDTADKERLVDIRNRTGTYGWLESSLPTDYAHFLGYEEEKSIKSTAAWQEILKKYTVKKTGKKSTLLGMPTEKLTITCSDRTGSIEVLVTKKIDAPIGLYFEVLLKVKDTPLEFTNAEYGWLNRYTLVAVKSQPVSDRLFQIDPKQKVMTTEQMLKEVNNLIK